MYSGDFQTNLPKDCMERVSRLTSDSLTLLDAISTCLMPKEIYFVPIHRFAVEVLIGETPCLSYAINIPIVSISCPSILGDACKKREDARVKSKNSIVLL